MITEHFKKGTHTNVRAWKKFQANLLVIENKKNTIINHADILMDSTHGIRIREKSTLPTKSSVNSAKIIQIE